ncbi:MAG: tyrosine--tRNA ligase [Elusimicrobiota bacterium]
MNQKKAQQQLEIIKRGSEEIIGERELFKKLTKGKILKVKFGADPTAPDLHLGHTVVMEKLKQFQELGHQVIFIIGDFTALIGDPSGRTAERPVLTKKEIKESVKGYKKQIFKILSKENIQIVYNSRWLGKLKAEDMLNLSGKYTVARMLERDDFSDRYKKGNPISITEFFYPLLQGYDSVITKADIEIGGTDQKFNLLVGREIQKSYDIEPQCILTMPLLEGTDGVQKMSKSYGNHIGINESPKDIYGKIMSISDELMYRYYTLLTTEDLNRIKKMHPMEAKKKLSFKIVSKYYSEKEAEKAKQSFERVFSKKKNPKNIEKRRTLKKGEKIVDFIYSNFEKYSKTQLKRLINQGGIELNGEKVRDINYRLKERDSGVIKIGKKDFLKIERTE